MSDLKPYTLVLSTSLPSNGVDGYLQLITSTPSHPFYNFQIDEHLDVDKNIKEQHFTQQFEPGHVKYTISESKWYLAYRLKPELNDKYQSGPIKILDYEFDNFIDLSRQLNENDELNKLFIFQNITQEGVVVGKCIIRYFRVYKSKPMEKPNKYAVLENYITLTYSGTIEDEAASVASLDKKIKLERSDITPWLKMN